MKHLKNEKGSAAIYLLWIMTVIIVLSVIIVNVAQVYAVKQQASTAAQLGAFAATSEVLFATQEAIKEFDEVMIATLEEGEEYEPLWDEINERKNALIANGYGDEKAFIKTLNEMLPGRLGNPILKGIFNAKFLWDATLSTKIYNTVQKVVQENEGNEEHLEVIISDEKFRVEVKTDATFKTVATGEYIDPLEKDIPQIGYGPELAFLQYVLE